MASLEVDSLWDYGFAKLNSVYHSDWEDEPDEIIRAELIVNSDTSRDIRLAEAKLRNDTLSILIYKTDPAYHHEYTITIIKDRCYIKYRFLMSGDTENEGDVFPINTSLKLSSLHFYKGKEISGYTEFKGRCIFNCYEDLIFVKGNFKVRIE